MSRLSIRLLKADETPPWALLLESDPTRGEVETYLPRGRCYLAFEGGRLVGAFVLMDTRPHVVEIMNIAVAPELQSRGIGTRLLRAAVRLARKQGAEALDVGTCNCCFRELAFYQRFGFRMVSIDRDFFARRSSVIERIDGIVIRDMVHLSIEL
ncbi:MAG: GNAT family N-acetyltransferase [Alphaproteobacteria bacterium]